MPIKSRIRTIPDHPKPGIQFRDITTLLKDPAGLRAAIDGIVDLCKADDIDKVAAIEARGFILGGAVAHALEAGFVPVRKQGKLPAQLVGEDYQLEYGTDRVELHADAVSAGERVLVVDDLIATGGTAGAAIKVLEQLGAVVVACAVVVDLPDLGGARKLEAAGYKVVALCEFEGA